MFMCVYVSTENKVVQSEHVGPLIPGWQPCVQLPSTSSQEPSPAQYELQLLEQSLPNFSASQAARVQG